MTELELGEIQIETSAEDGDTIKKLVANKSLIEGLMNECYTLNNEKKAIENKLKKKKDEFEDLITPLGIGKVISADFTMSHITTKRFSGWKDEDAVIELIPEALRNTRTMSFDRNKIKALVEVNELPKKILNLEKYSDSLSIRFTPIVDKIKRD